jgi:hypothetical protein
MIIPDDAISNAISSWKMGCLGVRKERFLAVFCDLFIISWVLGQCLCVPKYVLLFYKAGQSELPSDQRTKGQVIGLMILKAR